MIAAANVAPNFLLRRSIHADDLKRIQEPAVIYEYDALDADDERYFVYTVAGWLDGVNVANMLGGATVGGDVITVVADSRASADMMAGMGLEDTINALHSEETQMIDALAAQARLQTVGAIDRMDLAIAKDADKSDQFEEDSAKIRILVGDDLILAAGH